MLSAEPHQLWGRDIAAACERRIQANCSVYQLPHQVMRDAEYSSLPTEGRRRVRAKQGLRNVTKKARKKHTNPSHLQYSRVAMQHRFDLCRRNILSAMQNHVLAAVYHANVTPSTCRPAARALIIANAQHKICKADSAGTTSAHPTGVARSPVLNHPC